MALDDFEERFAAAVKSALDASRTAGEGPPVAAAEDGCPSLDSISAYYEGTVGRSERTSMEEHFAGCSKCQGTLAALLRAAPEEAGHEARVQAGGTESEPGDFAEPAKAGGRPWRIAGIAAGAALVAAAGLGGFYIYRMTGTSHSHSAEIGLNQTNSNAAYGQPSPSVAVNQHQSTPASTPAAQPEVSLNSNSRSGMAEGPPAPPAVGPGTVQGDAESASADQAEAALGALASTPAPPVAAASPSAARPSAVASASTKFTEAVAAASAKTPIGAPSQPTAAATKAPALAPKAAAGPSPAFVRAIPAAPKRSSEAAGSKSGHSAIVAPQRSIAAQQAAADEKRRAKLVREAKAKAEKEAKLRTELAKARREAQIRAEIESAKVAVHREPPPRRMASTTPLQEHGAPGSNRSEVTSTAPPAAPALTQSPARIEPTAPVAASIAPGIPVAPRAILVASPDHRVYWSLQNSGVIYRTNDRKSWAPQYSGTTADLLAGMAPSETVCWAVGRRGTILLTTDGARWEKIKSPTTSDVTGVRAAGKDVATIYTADGLSYDTWDGGSNWQPIK